MSMSMCMCCMTNNCQLVKYLIGDEWLNSLYCSDCVKIIKKTAWETTKQNLMGVDCLAAFKKIQIHGLSTTLTEHDMIGNKSYIPVKEIKIGKEPVTGSLDIDLTKKQCEQLVNEIRALNINDVSNEDIKVISSNYW